MLTNVLPHTSSSEAQTRLALLNKKLEEQGLVRHRPLASADVGQLCICPPVKQGRNVWRRAQIVNSLDDDRVKVYFIDYGSFDYVNFLDLLEIPPELERFPLHVRECRLCNIDSFHASEVGWTAHTINAVRDLLNQNRGKLTCTATAIIAGVVIVDLGIGKPSDVKGEGPTSIKDILIFWGNPLITRREEKRVERCQYYEVSDEVFYSGSTHIGTVRCTWEPEIHYISLPGEMNKSLLRLQRIRRDMTAFFSSKEGRCNYTIECPRVNQPCGVPPAAGELFFSRGRILSVNPGSRIVTVLCVDEGKKRELPLDDLRLLPSRYMEHHTLGIYFTLYGIQPSGISWTENDLEKIRSLIDGKTFKVFVDQKSVDAFGIHKMTLYESFPEKDVLINALIIKNNWATASTEEAASWQIEYYKANREDLVSNFGPNMTSEDLEYKPYTIRRVYSPARMFLSNEVEMAAFAKLSAKMSNHYRTTPPEDPFALVVGGYCAVFSSGAWVRGKIISSINENACKVFLLDHGVTNVIVHQNLRCLKDEFSPKRLLPMGSFFHVGDMLPAEGTEWSQDACQYFKDLLKMDSQLLVRVLDGPTVYFGKDHYSFPVSIIVQIENNPDPLEPSQVTLHGVATDLIAKRLAIPQNIAQHKPSSKPSANAWIPPTLPLSNKVVGTICYVDENAYFYIITPESKELLQAMDKLAHQRFKNLPRKPHDCYWYEGQACYARFHWDDNWYRGQVKAVQGDGNYHVQLIDYGTMICVSDQDMRKDVILTEIPCLSLQIHVQGLRPKNGLEWQISDVLAIHTVTVDKEVEVQLVPLAERKWPLMGKVMEAEGRKLDIADILAYLNLAKREE